MKLTYDFKNRQWNNADRLLSKHDVVFRAPVCDPTYGIPTGDGDTGCLFWFSPESLNININKTDLWDDSTADEDLCCPMTDENLTVNRHGAKLTLDFGCPIFECIYTRNFEARLSLREATAKIHSETAFAKADIRAFSSHKAEVTVMEADVDFTESAPVSVSLKRWGSRSFFFWYNRFSDTPEKGLGGTASGCTKRDIFITQHLNGTDFCCAVRALHECQTNRTAGGHTVKGELEENLSFRLKYLITLATGDSIDHARSNATAKLDHAEKQGIAALYADHLAEWTAFWSRSFVSLPEKQDYIENLWYLNLYYANCEMRGKYPPHFCNGIWNFYYDFVPWNHYFHYNMQQSTFPLDTANHPELLDTYYRFMYDRLENAKRFAKEKLGRNGAIYADVCDRYGRNDIETRYNCTCGSQIAASMYRHYLYTGDEKFLYEQALPVMKAAGEFYLDMLKPEDDGIYHIHETQCYEGNPLVDDSITDLSMIRCLFAMLCEVLPKEESAPYRERLGKLPPYVKLDMYDDELDENGIITRGIGKGHKARGNKVLGVGKKADEGYLRRTFGNPEHDYYGFPDAEMATVFPSGLVGLKDQGSELFGLVQNSVLLHHTAETPNGAGFMTGDMATSDETCMGWCMEPIYLARLGMARELEDFLNQTVSTWMLFPQGFGIYGPYNVFAGDNNLRWKKNQVANSFTGEKSAAPAWNFRHFDYETLPIIATAVNEMLLQSYDGTLRLFPALPEDAMVCFRLKASGGFIVNAAFDHGEYDVYVESVLGGTLRLSSIIGAYAPIITDIHGNPINAERIGEALLIHTKADEWIHISSGDSPLSNECRYYINDGVKRLGKSQLGEEKYF